MKFQIHNIVNAHILVCLFLFHNISAQNQQLKIHKQVTISDLETPYGEPFIAVNPGNASELAISGMFTRNKERNSPFDYDIAFFISKNQGKSWEKSATPKVPNSIAKADPWLVWGENGNLYFSCIAFVKGEDNKLKQQAYAFYSANAGETWSAPVSLFKGTTGHDHPTITFNAKNKFPITIFTTGGRGSSSTQIELLTENLSESKVVVHSEGSESNNNLGAGVPVAGNGFAFIQTKGMNILRSVSSSDLGASYTESVITEDVIPYGFPMLAINSSNNNLYATWSERGDVGTQIFMSYSSNHGESWSDKKQISQNSESINLMPQIEINKFGEILILWVSSKSDKELYCYSVNYAKSTDGGNSFNQNSFSNEKHCAATEGNGAVVQKWKLGGDYFGITSDNNGDFHTSWVDSRTGINQIWYCKIKR